MNTKSFVPILIGMLMNALSFAQVTTHFIMPDEFPSYLETDLLENLSSIPTVEIPDLSPLDKITLKKEDEISKGAYRFAQIIPTAIQLPQQSQQFSTSSNTYWALMIKTEQALSLSLTFRDLDLPKDAELFISSTDKRVLFGPLTREMYRMNDFITSEIIPGNSVILIVKFTNPPPEDFNITISNIGYGYREGGIATIFQQRTLPCHVDVIEPRGYCHRVEQRAVTLILVNLNTAICSGSLISNTNAQNDLTPFILTADHCMYGENGLIDPSDFSFRFLDITGNNSTITFIGADLISQGSSFTDIALLRLNNNPQPQHKLFYLGWQRESGQPTSGYVVHHPAGDKMKITHDANEIQIHTPEIIDEDGTHFDGSAFFKVNTGNDVNNGDFGILEKGSSGSPLINTDHRVVGVTARKLQFDPACVEGYSTSVDVLSSRFVAAWSPSNIPALRLRDHLDPLGTDLQSINSTFELIGSSWIPCYDLRQDLHAPLLHGGTYYSYVWRHSPNLMISGVGSHVLVHAIDVGCYGCAGWVECDIISTAACGNQLVATSVRHIYTWTPTPGVKFAHKITPHTLNNGENVGYYNTLCVDPPQWVGHEIEGGLKGIPIPEYVDLQWTCVGLPPGQFGTSGNDCWVMFNDLGWFSLTCSVLNGTGCMKGYKETYYFEVRSVCGPPVDSPDSEDKIEVRNTSNVEFSIYPNPAKGLVDLIYPQNINLAETSVSIMDLNGKVYSDFQPSGLTEQVNISSLGAGLYFIRFRSRDLILSKKLIVLD